MIPSRKTIYNWFKIDKNKYIGLDALNSQKNISSQDIFHLNQTADYIIKRLRDAKQIYLNLFGDDLHFLDETYNQNLWF